MSPVSADVPGAPPPLLDVRGVSKVFPPRVKALHDASLRIRRGEVHCLLGANGAGKSTLMKIIAGAHPPNAGEIRIDGNVVQFRSPQDARRAGIAMIYQELDLVPQLTVEENLLLGHVPAGLGFIRGKARREMALQALARVGAGFGPQARVESLSVANQQLTAIARALTTQARLIVMDEPSAALNEREIAQVFDVIRELVRSDVSVLYVSHRLHEIRAICERITVLRGGRTVATHDVADVDERTLISAVIGEHRALLERVERTPPLGEVALHVHQLDGPSGIAIRDFHVRQGEIVGLTGLNGAGRSTFLRTLFGDGKFRGRVTLHGKPYAPRSPRAAMAHGVGLVPESRKTQGLVLDAPVYINASLPSLRRQTLVRRGALKARAASVLKALSTRLSNIEQPVRQLSGGNQQKVVFAKWLIDGSKLLLLDEPSRGLDVGAKADLYALARQLADDGAAVVIASSELDELYAHCDQIWVMHEGRNVACFDPQTTRSEQVLQTTILGHPP
ncbi:sugar ABC transporter ATP-binding protein [Verminephrobacter eiseniae]|uniref:sugar ABC transporter ATP-binding protein n=1 Tax=Verminephrobacter eiseniae TaxID=364317 RepID=UPI0022386E2D|nr:sugar ABC transporter ATP-binding protein [Verminephrobacter eiseniae]MCW5232128.1 sugar ABC transporter ATP-binding protein [Verminephrobacter eiseniae]MCW5262938.1 sugar ABC transporter ATP-binding protein [Verminephrobacter eiseniae]MCW5296309.1 sugar ABC transporter ATP-binding protein [Verminephrobacter eiseniae]MCW8184077.1 sugar ABC transporter ATP-binding protein [Verminephrobacter eiseniae]MCW8222604.1 sugar ABC transporter ATP-binding protein [Verminephrobacter eiseniae]